MTTFPSTDPITSGNLNHINNEAYSLEHLMPSKLTIEEMKATANKRGGIFLSETYEGSDKPHIWHVFKRPSL